MTKNRSMKIAVLVLALALLTSCFVGSTFAKYTSSATGTDDVTVAKWAVTANGADLTAASPVVTFDFFETFKDDATTTTDETGVKGTKLAPGTKGSFSFDIVNNSDVWAEYSVDLAVAAGSAGQLPTNIKFSTDGTTYDMTLAQVADTLTGKLAYTDGAADGDDEVTCTVYWMWAFETAEGDDEDTADGVAAKTITLQATITVDQLDQAPQGE